MAADQPGPERQEVPLGPRGLQHILGVDAEPVEHQRQLVDQRDVDVALDVLDDLGRFGDADRLRAMRPGADDARIERVDEIRRRRIRTRRDLDDVGQSPRMVAGIDALRAVAAVEIRVEAQAGAAFEDRYAGAVQARLGPPCSTTWLARPRFGC